LLFGFGWGTIFLVVLMVRTPRERSEQMFVLDSELVTQVTNLREALEKVAMREDIHESNANWLFALCETLSQIG
jgi:hypothetical protein